MLAMPLVFIASPAGAAVDECTWTGAVNGDMSNGGNWTGCDNGGVPENGDSLHFPSIGITTFTFNNDLAIILDDIRVDNSNMSFSGNMLELSGTLEAFSSPTFSSLVRFTNNSGQTGLNVQGNPTFSGGVDMNITAPGFMRIFTTSSTWNLPEITGSAPLISFAGNPGLPLEVFNTPTTAQTYTGDIYVDTAAMNCQSASNCLGNSANTINITSGFATQGLSSLRLNATALSIANPIILDDNGSNEPPRIEANDDATITGTIDLSSDAVIYADNGVALLVNGAVNMGSNTITYSGVGSQIVHNGIISGTGNVIVDGYVQLINTNTYSGTTTITTDGYAVAYSTNSLGTTAGDTTISDDGTLLFNPLAPITTAENINTAGTIGLFSATDNVTLSGNITLTGNTKFELGFPGSSSDMEIEGPISGTGDLTFVAALAAGNFRFSGTSVNNYVGDTNITGTTLIALKSGAGTSIPGDINVAATATNASTLLVSGNGAQIADDSIINLTNNGANPATFESDDPGEVIGTITGNGHIESDGPGEGFTIGGGNTSGTFTGSFDNEDGEIVKTGTGTWTLSEATFPGGPANPFTITINDGSVVWGGNLAGMPVTVASGGTLKGTGTAGATTVDSGGTLSTGTSPGCLTLASLSLTAGSTFTEEIDGTTACTGYDQTTVTGTAALGNATLSVASTATPSVGTVFTILTAGSITGTFDGLADGATLVANNVTYRINYTGTAVTLTVIDTSTTTIGALPITGFGFSIFAIVITSLLGAGALALRLSRRRNVA